MASCMLQPNEKSLAQQKRCSLPGPSGSLNLYAAHQQRRLSERGLMIYRPNKPDIDLIRDFTATNQRKNSSPCISFYQPGPSSSSLNPRGPGPVSAMRRRSYSPSSFTEPGPSGSPSFQSMLHDNSGGGSSSSGNSATGTFTSCNNGKTPSSPCGNTSSSASGCRKVLLKIQKSPGSKEKYVEFHADVGSSGKDEEDSSGGMFLPRPKIEGRRFSDSAACRGPPAISISMSGDNSDSGIVCSTGDLLTLKCLTSSAQEIRFYNSPYESERRAPSPEMLGNRSKSFDATLARKGAGSSWFSRRHLPISVKLPISLKSPSVPNSPLPQQPPHYMMKAPILTITNENGDASPGDLIEIPSPPAVTPVSSGSSPGENTTVAWDQNQGGTFVLDAALLGFAIENHLRKVDMSRRATFSTLYEAPPTSMDLKVTARPRSASACTIAVPKEMAAGVPGGRRESIGGAAFSQPMAKATSNRRSSLKSDFYAPTIAEVRSWDRGILGKDRFGSYTPLDNSNMEIKGSFIKTTMVDFGADCIDEEEEGCPSPGPGQGKSSSDSRSQSTFRNGRSARATDGGNRTGAEAPLLPESPASSSGNSKKGNEAGNGFSICGAIRDFILHSIRS